MAKRSQLEDTANISAKKLKLSTSIDSLTDEIWSQMIFSFLTGNELFRSIRLVSSTWNHNVLSNRCEIHVSFMPKNRHFYHRTESEERKRTREFIEVGKRGIFKNVVSLTFLSKIDSDLFENIVTLDWQHLERLDLSGCSINDEGVKQLSEGNMNNLKSLKILCNDFGLEGSKYLLTGCLSNLTELNSQRLSDNTERYYYAITSPYDSLLFTVHRFQTRDELKSFIYDFHKDFWIPYASEPLGLNNIDNIDSEDLKERVYALPIGQLCELAVKQVGRKVYTEHQGDGLLEIIYGLEIDKDNFEQTFLRTDESTPFYIRIVNDCEIQFSTRSPFLEFVFERCGEMTIKDPSERFKQILGWSRNSGVTFFIGEIMCKSFVELHNKHD